MFPIYQKQKQFLQQVLFCKLWHHISLNVKESIPQTHSLKILQQPLEQELYKSRQNCV